MALRDHEAISISKFNGLWDRGNPEEVPQDHFTSCNNLRPIADGSLGTRFGIDFVQDLVAPLGNIVRIYNYPTADGDTYICLTYDGTTGKVYHVVNPTTMYGPVLTIIGMEDFAFLPYAGRGYISPFATFTAGNLNVEKGLEDEFLYVYMGDGTAATKAAGAGPADTPAISAVNAGVGQTDAGLHLFGVVYETSSGYLSPPGAFDSLTTLANSAVSFSSIPTSLNPKVVKRHIVATVVLPVPPGFNGDFEGYDYYFIPGATLNDNVTTSLADVSFFDADLLDDASHLFDNFSEIPAGCNLTLYHNRLCLCTTFDDISIVLVSEIGEPEAINQIQGLLVVPPDGNPVTNMQEYKDVFYVTKRAKTVSFTDNGDEPATWPLSLVDNAYGSTVHGIATILDSGSNSVDYLLIANMNGICIFSGRYNFPEISWKIQNLWTGLDQDNLRLIQLCNDSINKLIYCALPDRTMIIGEYSGGLDPQSIRWFPWSSLIKVNTIALVDINRLIIGSQGVLP